MGEWGKVIMGEGVGLRSRNKLWEHRGELMVMLSFLSSLLPPLSSLLTQSFHTHQQEIKFPAALVDVIREIAVEWHK